MKILQNLFLLSVILFLSVGVNADTDRKQKYIPEEVIVFVTLKVNKNNSKEKIKAFTKMAAYHSLTNYCALAHLPFSSSCQ